MDPKAIRVLLVDDEPDFMETLGKRLSLRKLEVQGVGSGAQALDALKEYTPDVVVLDVKMPGMDGIQVLREIKKKLPMVEVILLTGHADLEASITGMSLGAFDYMLKPVALDELVYKIQDAHARKALQEKKINNLRSHVDAGGGEP
jgi:DNA-binding NtrC family response regulator